jgi:hypothetical protein
MQIFCQKDCCFSFGSQDINKTIKNKDIAGKIKAIINGIQSGLTVQRNNRKIQASGSSTFIMRGTMSNGQSCENVDSNPALYINFL